MTETITAKIVIISFILFCLYSAFLIIRSVNTCKKRLIIMNAIASYNKKHCDIWRNQKESISNDEISKKLFTDEYISQEIKYISFEKMEPYNKTLYRLWDWGYKNIVDADTYEKIKNFIY